MRITLRVAQVTENARAIFLLSQSKPSVTCSQVVSRPLRGMRASLLCSNWSISLPIAVIVQKVLSLLSFLDRKAENHSTQFRVNELFKK